MSSNDSIVENIMCTEMSTIDHDRAGLLSLPSELLCEIIQTCPQEGRCRLRAACKLLKEHADPIVFRRVAFRNDSPHIIEHQIITLATRSSHVCELTKEVEIFFPLEILRPSELSWPHFPLCKDLRVHLPTAISTLRNMTCFRWDVGNTPAWLPDLLIRAVASLPQLTELTLRVRALCEARVPFGRFSNLSKLSVHYRNEETNSFFVSQMATVIGNSPQLRYLEVAYMTPLAYDIPLPTLKDLFADLSTRNPLCLEQLCLRFINATADQETLPHLMKLTSFRSQLRYQDLSIARSVWTSLLVNNIQLSDVTIGSIATEEMLLYLSSFSGLKRLVVQSLISPPDMTRENLKNKLLYEVLSKHVDSLQVLEIYDWMFNPTSSKPVLKCLKLRNLRVIINDTMPVQRLLDTVAQLPELETLHFQNSTSVSGGTDELARFKPIQGLRYVERLEINHTPYMLERDGEPRYRRIQSCGANDTGLGSTGGIKAESK